MSLELTGTFTASLAWTQSDSLEFNTVTDDGNVTYTLSFDSGHANRVWSDYGTIDPSGGQVLIDLTAMTRDVLEGTITTNLAWVTGFILRNTTTVSGYYLEVGNTTNNWTGLFSSGNAVIKVGPNGFISFGTPVNGFAVTNSSSDIIRLRNPHNSGVDYQISIIGWGS